MNLSATRFPGNTLFSFLTQLFFSDQSFCASSCILLTNYCDTLTTQLLTHYAHLFTFIHLSTIKKEQYAVKQEVLHHACLNASFTTYRRRQGLLFYFCTSPDSPASRCYQIHSSNFKTALMYRKQMIPFLDCSSD